MKSTDRFKQTIKSYLEERGSKDPLFARIVTKPGKNMEDCITYILNTVQKSKCNGFADEEIYSMAIHYFDEDKIDVGKPVNCEVVVNHKVSLTEQEKKEAHDKAMAEEVEKARQKILGKDKKSEVKKEEDKKSVNTLF